MVIKSMTLMMMMMMMTTTTTMKMMMVVMMMTMMMITNPIIITVSNVTREITRPPALSHVIKISRYIVIN